jgi:hypothetical protein
MVTRIGRGTSERRSRLPAPRETGTTEKTSAPGSPAPSRLLAVAVAAEEDLFERNELGPFFEKGLPSKRRVTDEMASSAKLGPPSAEDLLERTMTYRRCFEDLPTVSSDRPPWLHEHDCSVRVIAIQSEGTMIRFCRHTDLKQLARFAHACVIGPPDR